MSRRNSQQDSLRASLLREQQAIWKNSRSEQDAQQRWEERKAEIRSFMADDTMLPDTKMDQTRRFAAQVPNTRLDSACKTTPVAHSMARSQSDITTRPATLPRSIPSQLPSTTYGQSHPSRPTAFSSSYTYGATSRSPAKRPALSTHFEDESYVVLDPSDFIARNRGNDPLRSASKRQRLIGIDTTRSSMPSSQMPRFSSSASSSSMPTPLSSTSPGLTASSYHLSPCPSFDPSVGGEAMSRQTSMSSTSMVEGLGMLRMGSNSLPFADDPSFSFQFDQQQDSLCPSSMTASGVSNITETQGSSHALQATT
ncbi:hypothetical protein LTR95_017254, partial [Oleoguttula sp. CCFEE 5521]